MSGGLGPLEVTNRPPDRRKFTLADSQCVSKGENYALDSRFHRTDSAAHGRGAPMRRATDGCVFETTNPLPCLIQYQTDKSVFTTHIPDVVATMLSCQTL